MTAQTRFDPHRTADRARQGAAMLQALLATARGDLDRLTGPGAKALEAHSRAHAVAARLRDLGAAVHMNTIPPRMSWHGVTVTRAEGGLALFEAWLRKASETGSRA